MRSLAAYLLAWILLDLAVPQAGVASMQSRIDSLAPGRWLEITENAAGTIRGSHISRVWPSRAGHPAWGNLGPRAVVDAWGGAAYDMRRDLFVVTGGGHRDYGGNEVYAFSMRSLEWRRLTEPSRLEADRSRTVDGTPISRHTYDALEYLPDLDRVLLVGGAPYDVGGGRDLHVWLFDTGRGTWQRRGVAPQMTYPAAAYDAATGSYFVRIYNYLFKYAPSSDRWTPLANHIWLSYGTMELDPRTRRLVTVADGKAWYYDLGHHGPILLRPIAADPVGTDAVRNEGPGLAYDPRGGAIIAWAGARDVWALDTRALSWSLISEPAGEGPRPGEDSHGIYGRWRYVPSRDVFIGLPSSESNVWVFRAPREPS